MELFIHHPRNNLGGAYPTRLHDLRHRGGYLHPPALGENPPDPAGHALGELHQLASGGYHNCYMISYQDITQKYKHEHDTL